MTQLLVPPPIVHVAADMAIPVARTDLTPDERAELFALIDSHFEGVRRDVFDRDLDEKDWVLRRKFGEVELQGRLVAEVPDPTSEIIYGVVEVDGLDRHLMVPRERIVFHGVEPDPFTVT